MLVRADVNQDRPNNEKNSEYGVYIHVFNEKGA